VWFLLFSLHFVCVSRCLPNLFSFISFSFYLNASSGTYLVSSLCFIPLIFLALFIFFHFYLVCFCISFLWIFSISLPRYLLICLSLFLSQVSTVLLLHWPSLYAEGLLPWRIHIRGTQNTACEKFSHVRCWWSYILLLMACYCSLFILISHA
jgi:hypothetical protein